MTKRKKDSDVEVGKKLKTNDFCIKRRDVEYCTSDCLPQTYTIKDMIGIGQNGIVFGVESQNKKLAIKIVPLNVNIPTEDCDLNDETTYKDCLQVKTEEFTDEADIANEMGKLNIGPKVHDVIICKEGMQIFNNKEIKVEIGLIIMERCDIDIRSYFKKYPKEYNKNKNKILKYIEEKTNEMNNKGYAHYDLHTGNVMVNLDANKDVKDVYVIDFGGAAKTKKNTQISYNMFKGDIEKMETMK